MKTYTRFLLMFVIHSTLTTTANASDWWYVTSDIKQTGYLVDVAGIRQDGTALSFWEQLIYQDTTKIATEKQRHKYRCSTQQSAIKQYVEYNSSGEVVKSLAFADEQFQNIVPDSVGETIMNFVCGTAAQRLKIGFRMGDVGPEQVASLRQALTTQETPPK